MESKRIHGTAAQTRHRASPREFDEFERLFPLHLAHMTGEAVQASAEGVCRQLRTLSKAQKTELYARVARDMGITGEQVYKHYVNAYRKALYPEQLDEAAAELVQRCTYIAVAKMRMAKGLYREVKRVLAEGGLEVFPGQIDSLIQCAKGKIEKGLRFLDVPSALSAQYCREFLASRRRGQGAAR